MENTGNKMATERRTTDVKILASLDTLVKTMSEKVIVDQSFFAQTVKHMNNEEGFLAEVNGGIKALEKHNGEAALAHKLELQQYFNGYTSQEILQHHNYTAESMRRHMRSENLTAAEQTRVKWHMYERIGFFVMATSLMGVVILGLAKFSDFIKPQTAEVAAYQHADIEKLINKLTDKIIKQVK